MASFAGGKIEAYVGPPELGAADDLEQVIVDFIRGAKSSLDIAVQEIDSRAIAQAILDARWRGIRVNISLEQDYLRSVKGSETQVRHQAPPVACALFYRKELRAALARVLPRRPSARSRKSPAG